MNSMSTHPCFSASIVVYQHQYQQVAGLVQTLLSIESCRKVTIIDNSPSPVMQKEVPSLDRLQYLFPGKNLGYGSGHNVALKEALSASTYHLVVNPDIHLEAASLSSMMTMMERSPGIGLLMPQVLYGNGDLQYLCKRFPTPFDLVFRRFLPGFLKRLLEERLDRYELRHMDYNKRMEVPNLSGCFMFLRVEVLRYVGLFDERFFMYLEDTDLCRRINMQFQTVYWPEVSIVHQYEKGSYKSFRLLKYHIVSAFRYFNKYGWFFDPVRTTINSIMR